MRALIRRWLAQTIPLVVLVSGLTFVLASLVPGDAARSLVGITGTEEQYLILREELGLDEPLPVRYGTWVADAVQGDLGVSILTKDQVANQLRSRLPITLWLVSGAVIVAGVLGIGMGVASARGGRITRRLVDVVSLLGAAVPSYWLGLITVYVFAVHFRVFPATGYVPIGESVTGWAKSLALPVITLGLVSSAPVAKLTRDAMLTELRKDYVVALRARGISERTVLAKHVLRNAAAPVVTMLGIVAVGLLSGTVLVETVFVLPGIGSYAVLATRTHDIASIQGVAVLFTLMVAAINLCIEIVYHLINPQVRAR